MTTSITPGVALNRPGTTSSGGTPPTARSTSIQNLATAGLLQLATAGTDTEASIATPAEIRTAAGLGTIAVQNSDTLTLSRNTTGQTAQLRLFGSAPFGNDQNNGIIFGMTANLSGNRQLQIYSSDDSPTAGAGLRVLFNGSSAAIDAVSPDGGTRQDMIFGSNFKGCGFGGFGPAADTSADFYQSTGRTVTARFRNAAGITIFTVGEDGTRLGVGATLNFRSPLISVTLTGATTQLVTVTVPAASGTFVHCGNPRITGECTGTGLGNVTLSNPAALTGSVSILVERFI
jgi:hypothetical protein